MVIKLAFNKEQKEKMMHEYRIYGQLSFKKNLEGIVTVHGMFQDPESKALGMLMDDAGQSLRRREMDRGGDGIQVTTTPAERFANSPGLLHYMLPRYLHYPTVSQGGI